MISTVDHCIWLRSLYLSTHIDCSFLVAYKLVNNSTGGNNQNRRKQNT